MPPVTINFVFPSVFFSVSRFLGPSRAFLTHVRNKGADRRRGCTAIHALSEDWDLFRFAKCRVLKGAGSQSVVNVWQHTLEGEHQQGFLIG